MPAMSFTFVLRARYSKLLLAPQAERLLGRTVGEAEQDGVRRGADLERVPARHDQHVVLDEPERAVGDRELAPAFEADEHGGVGAAVRPRPETGGKALRERADRVHRRAAGRGVQ